MPSFAAANATTKEGFGIGFWLLVRGMWGAGVPHEPRTKSQTRCLYRPASFRAAFSLPRSRPLPPELELGLDPRSLA